MTPLNLVLVGPPGVGKGTQGALLGTALGLPHISTGDIFRDLTRRYRAGELEGVDWARVVCEHMERNEFVPDELTIKVVQTRLAAPDCARGFILDGYPRSVVQAEQLAQVCSSIEPIVLTLPEETLYARLLGRNRPDDTPEIIEKRRGDYERFTAPLAAHYGNAIDGLGTVETVHRRVLTWIRVAFTIGHQRSYDRDLMGTDPVHKMGRSENYEGGWIWQTRTDAERFIREHPELTFPPKVYGVRLPTGWGMDVSPTPSKTDGVHRLWHDALVFQVTP